MARSRASEVLPPSKLRERKRKKRIILSTLLGVFILCLCGGVLYAMHDDAVRIRDVIVEGAQTIPPGDLETSVHETLEGSWWYIIPKNSALVYSGKKITTRILETFPKVKTARVSLENLHTVRLTLSERSPTALWCGVESGTAGSELHPCYFLDEGGFAYEEAADFSGSAYVRWYGQISSDTPPAHFLSRDVFHALHALVGALGGGDYTPVRVVITPERDVKVSFEENFDLLFTVAQKPEDVLMRLRTAQVSDVLAGKKLSDLQYLDLRFGNRLYYTFK